MDMPSSSQTNIAADEWDLFNDDGFIYKRRRVLTESVPVAADPEEEVKRRREWKRRSLVRVKEKYQKEILEWQILSKTLKSMQHNALPFQIQQRETEVERRTTPFLDSEMKDKDKVFSLVDELLLQAEAQEMIIGDVSSLCDIAEAMCDEQVEELKQFYFDLPIWATPRDLMASLCDEAWSVSIWSKMLANKKPGHRIVKDIGWPLLDLEWIKLNSDGNVKQGGPWSGGFGGVVLRDAAGVWLTSYGWSLRVVTDTQAELWGIFDGLELTWAKGYTKLIVKCDNSAVVHILNDSAGTSPFALIQSIKELSNRQREVRIFNITESNLRYQFHG